jgi:hypothetical protein
VPHCQTTPSQLSKFLSFSSSPSSSSLELSLQSGPKLNRGRLPCLRYKGIPRRSCYQPLTKSRLTWHSSRMALLSSPLPPSPYRQRKYFEVVLIFASCVSTLWASAPILIRLAGNYLSYNLQGDNIRTARHCKLELMVRCSWTDRGAQLNGIR